MKLIKTAGKTQIKLSNKEWKNIGKKAGWIKETKKIENSVIFYKPNGKIYAIAEDENMAFCIFKEHKYDFEVNGIRYKKDDWKGLESINKLFGETTMKVYMSNNKNI